VGGEGLAAVFAAKIVKALGVERDRVDLGRRRVLLQREQPASVDFRAGVGNGVAPGLVDMADRGIGIEGIAIVAIELPSRRLVVQVALGPDPPPLVIDLAVAEPEAADVAVGVERRIVLVEQG
jgi:hypothetical protein